MGSDAIDGNIGPQQHVTEGPSNPLIPLFEAHDEYVTQFRGLNSHNYDNNNFLKGAYWSPDGKVILSCSEDGRLWLYANPSLNEQPHEDYQVKPLRPWLQTDEGETVFDFGWYPKMDSETPSSCYFGSTSRDHPIHLFNPMTSTLLSYTSLDDAEQHTPIYSIAFHPFGHALLGGSCNKVFDYKIDRPGKPYRIYTLATRRSKGLQKGIISAFAYNTHLNLVACGSYAKSIFLYDTQSKFATVEKCLDLGTPWGGVTHLKWIDEYHLASSHRADNYIRYWDVRSAGEALFRFYSINQTQQRLVFDICEDSLITGDSTGNLSSYNMRTFQFEWIKKIQNSPVVSVNVHPYHTLLLTSSGTKSFKTFDDISTSESDDEAESPMIESTKSRKMSSDYLDNYLRIWYAPNIKKTLGNATSTSEETISNGSIEESQLEGNT